MNNENIFFDKNDLKHCGTNVIIGKTVRIRRPDLVSIGDNSIIDDFTYISGEVEIGSYAHIGASCSLQASGSKITIGDFSGTSSGVRVYGTSSNYLICSFDVPTIPEEFTYGTIRDEVVLEDFVWIGANSVVLPGCKFPTGFVCGALCRLLPKTVYKPWSVLVDDKGTMARRIGVKKLLAQAYSLTGKKYDSK